MTAESTTILQHKESFHLTGPSHWRGRESWEASPKQFEFMEKSVRRGEL